jgi:hypothetical protein
MESCWRETAVVTAATAGIVTVGIVGDGSKSAAVVVDAADP